MGHHSANRASGLSIGQSGNPATRPSNPIGQSGNHQIQSGNWAFGHLIGQSGKTHAIGRFRPIGQSGATAQSGNRAKWSDEDFTNKYEINTAY